MNWVRGHKQVVSWAVAITLLLLVMGLIVVAFYPGTIYYDSAVTIVQARRGEYTDWWTPAGSFALSIWLDVGLGLPLLFLLQNALFVVAVFTLAKHGLSTIWAAVATVVLVCWPPTFAQLSSISRDVFFYAFAIFALAALAAAYRSRAGDRKVMLAWLGGALVLSVASMLVRQNGIAVVIVVAGAGFVITGWVPAWVRQRRGIAALATVIVAALVGFGFFGLTQGVYRVTGVQQAHAEQVVYIYDLAAISKDRNENQFDEAWIKAPTAWDEEIYSLRAIKKRFSWKNVLSLYPPLSEAHPVDANPQQEAARLREQWVSAIKAHPLDYLNVRLRVNLSALGFFGRPDDAFPFYNIDAGPGPRFTNRNQQTQDVVAVFAGADSTIPLDITSVYILLGLLAGWVLWSRRPRDRGLIVAILAIEFLTVAVLFIATMATTYRYLALNTPLSMMLAAWAIAMLVAERRQNA